MTMRFMMGLVLLMLANVSVSDEIRPGYLELKESSRDVFSVLWKVPAKGGRKLALDAQLPGHCINKTQTDASLINGAFIQRWIVVCEGGLVEKSISIAGLESSNTDVLLRLEFVNGVSQSVLLTPTSYTFQIPAEASSSQVIGTYTVLGISHILMGVDHLLFVFACCLSSITNVAYCGLSLRLHSPIA